MVYKVDKSGLMSTKHIANNSSCPGPITVLNLSKSQNLENGKVAKYKL